MLQARCLWLTVVAVLAGNTRAHPPKAVAHDGAPGLGGEDVSFLERGIHAEDMDLHAAMRAMADGWDDNLLKDEPEEARRQLAMVVSNKKLAKTVRKIQPAMVASNRRLVKTVREELAHERHARRHELKKLRSEIEAAKSLAPELASDMDVHSEDKYLHSDMRAALQDDGEEDEHAAGNTSIVQLAALNQHLVDDAFLGSLAVLASGPSLQAEQDLHSEDETPNDGLHSDHQGGSRRDDLHSEDEELNSTMRAALTTDGEEDATLNTTGSSSAQQMAMAVSTRGLVRTLRKELAHERHVRRHELKKLRSEIEGTGQPVHETEEDKGDAQDLDIHTEDVDLHSQMRAALEDDGEDDNDEEEMLSQTSRDLAEEDHGVFGNFDIHSDDKELHSAMRAMTDGVDDEDTAANTAGSSSTQQLAMVVANRRMVKTLRKELALERHVRHHALKSLRRKLRSKIKAKMTWVSRLGLVLRMSPMLTTIGLSLSPLRDARCWAKNGCTGESQAAPFVSIFFGCIQWSAYGLFAYRVTRTPGFLVLGANAVGIALGMFYIVTFLRFCWDKKELRKLCLLSCAAGAVLLVEAGTIVVAAPRTSMWLLGHVAATCTLLNSCSILAPIREVWHNRCASKISLSIASAMAINSALWLFTGIMLHDRTLELSQLVSLATSMMCVSLKLSFPDAERLPLSISKSQGSKTERAPTEDSPLLGKTTGDTGSSPEMTKLVI